nr:plasmid segregation protein ParM domain-containing protein [Enterobacter kobei]
MARKRSNLLRELTVNKAGTLHHYRCEGDAGIAGPAAFSRLARLKPGPAETSLIIDLGGHHARCRDHCGGSLTTSAPCMAIRCRGICGDPCSPGCTGVPLTVKPAPLMADTVIRSRKDRAFLASIINDGDKIDYVTDKIEEAIATLGAQVIGELVRYRNVNRIFLVGGGAVLIEDAVRQGMAIIAGADRNHSRSPAGTGPGDCSVP